MRARDLEKKDGEMVEGEKRKEREEKVGVL